jgi:FtsP/CotA-like multicopper oxidase with cupredoxin domain
MQYPGPTLIVTQGQAVTVNLTNQLSVPVSMVFPGQTAVTATGGTPGLLTREATAGGGTVSYSFTANNPGTYIYYSGTQSELQVEMGLVGVLIVRPTLGAGFAYNDATTAFNREHLFFLSEIDPVIHRKVARGEPLDNTAAFPVYWFINGRAGFDTIAPSGALFLPNQPYGALVRLHPGEVVLARMVGGGRQLHPYHLHGNNHTVIARDARPLESIPGGGINLGESAFTTTVAPGQTFDALFTWTGAGLGWDIYGHAPGDPLAPGECPGGLADPACDHGKPIPVTLPATDTLTFGIAYSGSPYLGSPGPLPPGEAGFNPNAGLFFMWHSHNEKELTSNNIFPGGMLTFAVIEHPSVTIP